MKKLTILALACIVALAQGCAMITTESEPVQDVVTVESTDKDTLYVRANNWMVDAFRNADSVIQFSDKESGTISGRYLLGKIRDASSYGSAAYAYATIRINVRDDAARITVTPESFTYAQGNIYTLYTKEDMERDVQELIQSFTRAMKVADDTDW